MFHNQNRSITTGNYDKHIKASQDLIDACHRALLVNKHAPAMANIVVKDVNGDELFSRHRQDIRTLIETHEDNIRILKLMRAGRPITTDEFEQVTKLYDVRFDVGCFIYSNVADTTKP